MLGTQVTEMVFLQHGSAIQPRCFESVRGVVTAEINDLIYA
jgi:hypothetical protein